MGSIISIISSFLGAKEVILGTLALLIIAPIAWFFIKRALKAKAQKQAEEDGKKKSVEDQAKSIEANDKNNKIAQKDADKSDNDLGEALDKLKNKT